MSGLARLRVGRLAYLNSLPFRADLPGAEPRWSTAPPRRLGELAAEGELDAALLASRDARALAPTFRPLGDLGIASFGPVASVLLLSKRSFAELRRARIALTGESRTSRALLRILLAEGPGLEQIRFVPEHEPADARLWIGDRALRAALGAAGLHVVDLGTAWTHLTNLPFVWARWVVRRDVPDDVAAELEARLVASLELAPRITPRDVPAGLSTDCARAYLERFRYRLNATDLAGLRRFETEMKRHGLLDTPARCRPFGSAA